MKNTQYVRLGNRLRGSCREQGTGNREQGTKIITIPTRIPIPALNLPYTERQRRTTLAKRPRYANNQPTFNLGQKATLCEQPTNLQPSTK
ncbi:MAG: hypothetical protein F6J90_26560 [Moorea sp. SIOASIH]|uniref:hypothetical protein n=1 Tax=Moorena sp. SIOASIH TaxID=2607817 RepID=UPI0013BE3BFA|nr:hypothetical protein [Moorena sp. SIOASIH]NEO39698.1 hypothetical protein [Moorena sp. SIOASIH]